jgi:hypothetical protein
MGRIVKHPLSRLLGANSIIALHRDVIRAVGSYEAAALCEQVVYWMPKAEDPDGWVYKTADEWREELCFTRRGFDGARASLIALGILQHDYKRVKRGSTYTRVLSFRVDLEALYNALGADAQPVQADMYEAGKPSGGETYKPGLHETYKRKEQRLPTETTYSTSLQQPTLSELVSSLEGVRRAIWWGVHRSAGEGVSRWLLSDTELARLFFSYVEKFRPDATTLAVKLKKAGEEHGLERVTFALDRCLMDGKGSVGRLLDKVLAEGPKEAAPNVIRFPSGGKPRTAEEANEKLKADFEHGVAVLEALAGGAA